MKGTTITRNTRLKPGWWLLYDPVDNDWSLFRADKAYDWGVIEANGTVNDPPYRSPKGWPSDGYDSWTVHQITDTQAEQCLMLVSMCPGNTTAWYAFAAKMVSFEKTPA